METVYYDPSEVGSFGGVAALGRVVGYSKAKKWLPSQDTYTLHKPVRRKYERRQIFVPSMNHLWQLDLADLTAICRENDGYKFLLTCIDCFSRFAFVQPLQNKSAPNVRDAFARILSSTLRKPAYVQTDKGREFVNCIFQQYLRENNIKYYTSENDDIKCAIVERFNRTLKEKMWRYFTFRSTNRYIDVLQDIVSSYNNTYHSTIKTTPISVSSSNEEIVFSRLYTIKCKSKFKFKVGDKVRISETRRVFEKGYRPRWTTEIFIITSQNYTVPRTYGIKDLAGEEVKGKFYKEELQKVQKEDDIFKVEKILKTRKRKGRIEYFVRWHGYPPKFDSWVDSYESQV